MDSCTGSRNSVEVLSSEPFLGNNPNPRHGTARVSSSLSCTLLALTGQSLVLLWSAWDRPGQTPRRSCVRLIRAFGSGTVWQRLCRQECGLEVTVREQQRRRMKHENGEGEMERCDMRTANT